MKSLTNKKIGFLTTPKFEYSVAFLLFFFICIGLGYPVLNRFSVTSLGALSDSQLYFSIVKNGLESVVYDPYGRSTRVLVPMISHYVYLLMPSSLGSWDVAAFSMLIVSSVFCSLTGLIIFQLGKTISTSVMVGIIASLFYFLNFSISNFYLVGLVDSAHSFSFAILGYILFHNKWAWLPVISFFSTLAKEVFLPLGSVFVVSWFLYDSFQTKKIDIFKLWSLFLFIFISFATVTFLKSYVLDELIYPWQQFSVSKGQREYTLDFTFLTVVRFFYVFIWLLPLAIPSIFKLPKNWLISMFLSVILTIFLGIWVSISGAGFGRGVFNVAGAGFCIAAALTIDNLFKRMSK